MASISPVSSEVIAPLEKAKRDLLKSAALLSKQEARYLVDLYYQAQNYRIRAGHQMRTQTEAGEPHELVRWSLEAFSTVEKEIQKGLLKYAEAHEAGEWALSIHGIGPVIAAGLLAHIDIERAPTVGHIWRFAGLDPTVKWHGTEASRALIAAAQAAYPDDWAALLFLCRSNNQRPGVLLRKLDPELSVVPVEAALALFTPPAGSKEVLHEGDSVLLQAPVEEQPRLFRLAYAGVTWDWHAVGAALAKRPWNADLKRLAWIIGGSFVRLRAGAGDDYGKVYEERKALELARNERGDYADQAARSLKEKKYRKDTEARKMYEAGKLPLARIDLRARRYAAKLFLAHYHHVAYEVHFGTPPPKPYILEHGGHVHYIAPPKWSGPKGGGTKGSK